MKILSFIIPAYNSEAFLDKCIKSMLVPEVLSKLEIIVVDDGSKDNTAAAAQKYCDAYPQVVRLIRQENKGHGGALNTGCAAARGRYLKVIDADDWIAGQNLPAFISLLEACESDVVLTHFQTVNISSGEIKDWKLQPAQFCRSCTMEQILSDWSGFVWGMTLHGIAYRTDFYQKHGHMLAEHVFYEDCEFSAFPCCHAQTVTPLDLLIYEYRIGDVNQSVSDANQLKRISHIETVLHKMIAEYKDLPESPGMQFVSVKIHGLMLSYLTTALLVKPEKRAGRHLAGAQMEYLRIHCPQAYAMVKRKYQVLELLNRLQVRKPAWDALMESKLYALVRAKLASR